MPEIKLTLSKKTIAELDEFAEAGEVTRSETIRDLLAFAIDTLEDEGAEGSDQPDDEASPDGGEPPEDGGDDIAPEDVLVDSDGTSYFIDRARPLKDGSMAVKLVPLEEDSEGDESPPSDDDLDSEEPEAD